MYVLTREYVYFKSSRGFGRCRVVVSLRPVQPQPRPPRARKVLNKASVPFMLMSMGR